MNRSQKVFLLIISLYVIFDFILGSLVSLYLWEQTKSIRSILYYHLSLFFSIIVFTQLGSRKLSSSTPNHLYSASIIMGSLQAVLLFIFQESLGSLVVLFGFISGGVIGLQAVSAGHITQAVQSGESLRFISIKSAITNLVTLLSIPLLTFFINSLGSYTFSYLLGIGIGLVLISLTRELPTTNSSGNYQLIKATRELWSLPEMRSFLSSRLLYGIFNGPIWAVLGIVTLSFAGNLTNWGIISTALALTNIVGSYLFGKLHSEKYQISYAVIATLLFGAVTLFLGINWNFLTFLGYQLGLTLLGITFSLQFENSMYQLLNLNSTTMSYQKEIIGLGEICLGFGRLLVVGMLFLTNFTLENELYVRLLLLTIASIPLIISTRNKSAILYN